MKSILSKIMAVYLFVIGMSSISIYFAVDYIAKNEAFSMATLPLVLLVFSFCVGLLGSIFLFTFIRNNISTRLAEIDRTISSISNGVLNEFNMAETCIVTGSDDISTIGDSLNNLLSSLRTTFREIKDVANELTLSTSQFYALIEQTKIGAEAQEQQTLSAATAMNEMSATVEEVAKNANSAANAATDADTEAASGNQIVDNTIDVINTLATEVDKAAEVNGKLESESESIGAVLDVIRGIAEQTNLLALNAAIEAARAGEQGRGFAVVADEVRILAQRTQESTQEIRQMIERLQSGAGEAVQVMIQGRSQAQASVTQASKAGESLTAITKAVSTIATMNTQIARAAKEQSSVANDINMNISSIAKVSDETSSGAQEATRASEELDSIASKLKNLLSSVRV